MHYFKYNSIPVLITGLEVSIYGTKSVRFTSGESMTLHITPLLSISLSRYQITKGVALNACTVLTKNVASVAPYGTLLDDVMTLHLSAQ